VASGGTTLSHPEGELGIGRLSGGGDEGAVTLNVDASAIDPATLQRRVTGSCTVG
jgi:hypothetical protein